MAKRKSSLEKIMDGICSLIDPKKYCATVFLTNYKSGQVTLAQFGAEDRPPLSPVADIIHCSHGNAVIGTVLEYLDDERLEEIKDIIDGILAEREQEEGESSAKAEEPCCKCVLFEDKGCNFGICPHIENAFDGEEPNYKTIGHAGGCKYFNYRKEKR